MATVATARSGVIPVTAPRQLGTPVTINFDDQPARTLANTLYESQGITFTRDDGQGIPLLDWSALARTTTSGPNVLATVRNNSIGITSHATHVNVSSASPLSAIGA